MALIASCGGKLSEEERKALREEMENREIRQIRDEDIVNKALEMARSMRYAEDDSVLQEIGGIKTVYNSPPEDGKLGKLWEAYEDAFARGLDPGDNIQRDYPDWLIYTYIVEGDSGIFQMEALRIPRKSLVLSLEAK